MLKIVCLCEFKYKVTFDNKVMPWYFCCHFESPVSNIISDGVARWWMTSLAAESHRDVKGIPPGTGPMLCLKAWNYMPLGGLKAQGPLWQSVSCFTSLSWYLGVGREIQDHLPTSPPQSNEGEFGERLHTLPGIKKGVTGLLLSKAQSVH